MKQSLWQAASFMIISTLAFTILNATIKYLDRFSAFELVFFRAFGTLVITMSLLIGQKIPILGNRRSLLLARGIVGMIAMVFFYLALKELPFGSAITLRYLSPIFASIIAIIFLADRVRPIQWFYFLLAFLGVMILKGFDQHVSLEGLIYILIAALFSGVVYVLIRKIGKDDHPLVVVNYFMLVSVVVGLLFGYSSWKTPVGQEWIILGSLGILGFVGQYFMTRAFQIALVSKVAPFKYAETIFSLLISVSFFGEAYTLMSSLGIVLILGGMFLNLMVKGT